MNTLQQIIEQMEDEILQAKKQELIFLDIQDKMHLWYEGYRLACKIHVEKLKLLLNAETQTTVKKPEA